MRITTLLLLGTATVAVADPLTAEQTKAFQSQGYTSPAVVFGSPTLRVATARKAGKARLAIMAGGKVVDAGAQGKGTLLVTAPATAAATPGFTLLEVSYETKRPKDAFEKRAELWVVRDDGSIACAVSGSSSDSVGTACGSSGWTTATATLEVSQNGDGAATLDVLYMSSGNFSEPDGKGGCVNRSPVRGTHNPERWLISARGTCKKAPAAKP